MKDQWIIVTGGWGYLGSAVVELLLKSGYRLRVVDPHLHEMSFYGECSKAGILEWVPLDLVHHDNMPELFDGVGAVIHLGELSHGEAVAAFPDHAVRLNYQGTLSFARRAKLSGVKRFVFPSTCSLYQSSQETLVSELSPINPRDLLTQLKAQTEVELLALSDHDFAVTILRLPLLFGVSPRMRFDLALNTMVRDGWRSRVVHVHGTGKQVRAFLHVKDGASGVRAVLEKDIALVRSQIFNLGRDEMNARIGDLASEIGAIFLGTQIVHVPDVRDHRLYRVSFQKWAERIGTPLETSFFDGLRELAQKLESGAFGDSLSQKYSNLMFYKNMKSFIYSPLFAARTPLWEDFLQEEKQILIEKPFAKDASHGFQKKWPKKPRVIGVMVVHNGASELPGMMGPVSREVIDEIIMIDDGSKDASAQVGKHLGFKVFRHEQSKGYGASLKIGMKKALERGATYILEMGPDVSHCTTQNLEPALKLLTDGVDVAIGSRLIPPYRALTQGMSPWLFGLHHLKSWLTLMAFSGTAVDLGAGIRFYRAAWIEKAGFEGEGNDPFFGLRLLSYATRKGSKTGGFPWPYRSLRASFAVEVPLGWGVIWRGFKAFVRHRLLPGIPLKKPGT